MGGDMSSVDLGVGSLETDTIEPQLCSTAGAFAAKKADKTVVAWGHASYGGNIENVTDLLTDVVEIFSTREAFAALKGDGTVVTWGSQTAGGDSSAVAEMLVNIVNIAATKNTFAAINSTGAVFLWGDYEGEAVSADCKRIYTNQQAFACVMEDNTVRAFGNPDYGAIIPDIQHNNSVLGLTNVEYIQASYKCFAALTYDGKVESWGGQSEDNDGCAMPKSVKQDLALGGVVQVQSSANNFAALKADGSVQFWGTKFDPTDSLPFLEVKSKLQSGVTEIFSNYNGWAALTESGAVVVWGTGARNISSVIHAELQSDVTYVYASARSFAALKTGGRIVHWVNVPNAWGDMYDTSSIAAELSSDVAYVIVNERALVASRSDGSIVAWGETASGGVIPAGVQTEMTTNSGPYRVFGSDHFNNPMFVLLPTAAPTAAPVVYVPGAPTNAPVVGTPSVAPTERPTTSAASIVVGYSNRRLFLFVAAALWLSLKI